MRKIIGTLRMVSRPGCHRYGYVGVVKYAVDTQFKAVYVALVDLRDVNGKPPEDYEPGSFYILPLDWTEEI